MGWHKDWQAIAKEPNELLRALFLDCEDERILDGLRLGFPQFFTDAEQMFERVPVSVLRGLSRKRAKEENPDDPDLWEIDGEFDWAFVLDTIKPNIPTLTFDEEVPYSICKQLKGQVARGGMKVTYQQTKYVVIHIWALDEFPGEVIKSTPKPQILILTHEQYIDLES
jgi:hypothetical protein